MYKIISKEFDNKHFLQSYTLAEMNEKILDMIKEKGRLVKIKIPYIEKVQNENREIIKYKNIDTKELMFMNTKIEYPQNQDVPKRTKWTSRRALEEYSKEILTDIVPNGFNYTYGFLLKHPVNQIVEIIYKLKNDPNSRQATMMLGDATCLWDLEPPCCRIVDFKLRDNKLNMHLLFRSHDATAYYCNMFGFIKLQEYIANNLGINIGYAACTSESLHLYRGDWNLLED